MTVKDPVCGMTIEESDAAATTEFKGRTYFFCTSACMEEFEKDPDRYAG